MRPCHPDENAAVGNNTITILIDVLSLILHRHETSAPHPSRSALSTAPCSGVAAFLSKVSLSFASLRYEETIERFVESGVPSSARLGIWNAKIVFSGVDLLAMTGQSPGTEN